MCSSLLLSKNTKKIILINVRMERNYYLMNYIIGLIMSGRAEIICTYI